MELQDPSRQNNQIVNVIVLRCLRLWRVLLGQRPSLHSLRQRSPALVRLFHRYYAAVRLPAAVHEGLIAHRVLLPAHSPACGRQRGLPVLVHGVSTMHAWGLRLRRTGRALALSRTAVSPSDGPTPLASRITRFRSSIPSLQIPLSNASSAALRLPSHGSGPERLAIPSLYD